MIWSFPRRSSSRPQERSKSHLPEMELFNSMVRIPDRNFFGRYTKSPNGEYILAWRDADPGGGRGGYRNSGKGDYILIHHGLILTDGRMERPNDGRVCDSGRFALSDWRFGDALRSTFHVFDSQGETLFAKEFKANALYGEISSDGRFAIFVTARSKNADSNKMSVIDIDSAAVLWSRRPEPGLLADRYEFDAAKNLLWLVYDDRGSYSFSLSDGAFLDSDSWETERRRQMDSRPS